jgi:ferritin-like metal-binding protein YciE
MAQKNSNIQNTNKSAGNSSQEKRPGENSYLETFFTDQLKDIYYAENKILEGLKKMIKATTTDELKDAFQEHYGQTEKHVKRLTKVFELLGKKAEGKKCDAIEGILKEAESIIDETEEGTMTRDAALIFAAQKVEHYEIATYGGLVQFAITLQLHEAADILDRTLREEENTDSMLTEIAENDINLAAEHEGNEYSWDKQDQEADMAEEEA